VQGADSSLETDHHAGRSWVVWPALIAAALVLIGFRLHAFDLPLETDECNYAYIGGRLLEGDRLYVDVWDHQPFGVFALFAGVMAIAGDSPEVFRWTAVAFSLASLGLIFAIVRLVAGRWAAIAAAIMFAIASSDPGTAGEGCNREIYMNTLILAAWFLALRPTKRPGSTAFAAGTALALCSCLKTIVAVHWLLLGLWLAVTTWRRAAPKARVRSVTRLVVLFAAGPALLWLGALCYFVATDRGRDFVDAVFLFNLSYSGGSEPFFTRFAGFFTPQKHPFIFDSALPLWIGGAASIVVLLIDAAVARRFDGPKGRAPTCDIYPSSKRKREVEGSGMEGPVAQAPGSDRGGGGAHARIAVLLLVVGSYIAACLPAQFWPHYYYLLIPAIVISLSAALGILAERLRSILSSRPRLVRIGSIVAVFAVFPVGLLITEYRSYVSQPPFGITITRYNSRDFWGRAHGENIRRLTDPDDTIFVFGNEAEVYYYAQRRCASRYTMITGLQSGYAGHEKRRATLMAELERHKPRVIVVVFDEDPFDEWRAFLNRYYGEPIGWDFHDRTGEPIMFVLARKDEPVQPIDWNWDRKAVGGWQLGDRR